MCAEQGSGADGALKPVSPSWTVGVLVEAPRSAPMICVGWKGVTHSRRERSGSTAAGVARTAHSAVAVIRRRHANPFPTNLWIVGVGQSPGSDAVLRTALDEARLREAPLLTFTTSATGAENTTSDADDQDLHTELAQRLANAGQEDGGVEICDISMPTSLLDFLAPSTNIFQLVVCRKR